MATKSDQEAFPSVINSSTGEYSLGLNKREYFAAMAMQGMVANGEWTSPEETARHAIRFAEALINELNKQQ